MRTAIAVLTSVLVLVSSSARADEQPEATAREGELTAARAQIDVALLQMRATSSRVREQLRSTRKRGTGAQIACVDEALSRSDVALRHARELGDQVLAAYARGDVADARASLGRLVEMKESQRVAAVTSTACTPSVLRVATSTTVKLEISPTIAPAL